MSSLINIALTGLQSQQTALRTTGNNVSNVNTPGYSRQEVVFKEAISQKTGAGFQGTGATINTIKRQTQEFITAQVRSDTTLSKQREALLNEVSQIDSLLASKTTGLTPALTNFFKALQGASNDPTSVPQRQLLLTQAQGLVTRFHSLDSRLVSQTQSINQKLSSDVSAINALSSSIAKLNRAIAIAQGAGNGNQPNSLLDQRDEALRKLSEKVAVSSIVQADGRTNVYIGKGQPLVLGNQANQLTVTSAPDDASRVEIGFSGNGNTKIISDQIKGGQIGGTLQFRDQVLNPAINSMGRIAIAVADSINKQHKLGMDLQGNLGGDFFSDINSLTVARGRVQGNANNAPPANQVLNVTIDDASQITTDNYELQIKGPSTNDYLLLRKPSNSIVQQGVLPGILPATIHVEGLKINLESGTFQVGDKFLIQPTKTGAQDISVAIDRVEKLAFASPIRSQPSLGNRGSATISQGKMLAVTNPLTNQPIPAFATQGKLTPPMAVRFIDATHYEVLNVSDPANPKPLVPPLNNQLYTPGMHNEIFPSDPGATIITSVGSSVSALPAPVASPGPYTNGYGAQNITVLTRDPSTGAVTTQVVGLSANDSANIIANKLGAVQGIQANAYSQVNLRNFIDNGAGAPLGLTLNGQVLSVAAPAIFGPDELAKAINANSTLQQSGIYATSSGTALSIKSNKGVDLVAEVTGSGDSITADKVSPYTGSVLGTQVITSGSGVAVGGFVDLKIDNGITMTANVNSVFQQAPPAQSSFLGFKMDLIGDAKRGDTFSIGYNTGGSSDNRNILSLSSLETKGTIGNGVNTYGNAYSQIVEQVGTTTNQARLDKDSSTTLLQQSTANKASISGVNLDEEAGRLIQFQSAYSASAQVVKIARQLFNTLLSTFQ